MFWLHFFLVYFLFIFCFFIYPLFCLLSLFSVFPPFSSHFPSFPCLCSCFLFIPTGCARDVFSWRSTVVRSFAPPSALFTFFFWLERLILVLSLNLNPALYFVFFSFFLLCFLKKRPKCEIFYSKYQCRWHFEPWKPPSTLNSRVSRSLFPSIFLVSGLHSVIAFNLRRKNVQCQTLSIPENLVWPVFALPEELFISHLKKIVTSLASTPTRRPLSDTSSFISQALVTATLSKEFCISLTLPCVDLFKNLSQS